jgi:RNA-binding protein 23/39
MDRSTKRSKGFAYIEFMKQDSVLPAMGLNKEVLLGQQVMVKSAEAEKNMAWEAQQQATASNLNAALLSGAPCRLLVSNLRVEVTEVNLRPLFEPFGALDSLEIHRDLSGASKGQASVQFKNFEDASRAMQHLNGMDVAGLVLKITIVPPSGDASMIPGLGELDEDEENGGGGLRLTSQTRAALMNRLASSAGLSMPGGQAKGGAGGSQMVPARVDASMAIEQGVLGPASPIPTVCLLLKNMFDPTQESEPDWDKEIANDVKEECSKFSAISHVFVDRNSKVQHTFRQCLPLVWECCTSSYVLLHCVPVAMVSCASSNDAVRRLCCSIKWVLRSHDLTEPCLCAQGFVYLKFATLEGSQAAQRSLHGRFFAGKQIAAEYQFLQPYNNHFKC